MIRKWCAPALQPLLPSCARQHPSRRCARAQIRDFVADKLNFVGQMRVRTALELSKGFAAIRAARGGLKMPVYAHHGTADEITSPKVQTPLTAATAGAAIVHVARRLMGYPRNPCNQPKDGQDQRCRPLGEQLVKLSSLRVCRRRRRSSWQPSLQPTKRSSRLTGAGTSCSWVQAANST